MAADRSRHSCAVVVSAEQQAEVAAAFVQEALDIGQRGVPGTAAALRYEVRRSRRARWWNHLARAWWRRLQRLHRRWWCSGRWRRVIRLNRRLISATVSGISPGSGGGGWSDRVGIGI